MEDLHAAELEKVRAEGGDDAQRAKMLEEENEELRRKVSDQEDEIARLQVRRIR
jgi:hypothetical protein